MNSKMAYEKYKKTSVESASKERILLMLYEAAIKFTKKAIAACEQKDIAEKGVNIGRTFDIINELNNTLNHKIGGELATKLEALYNFITEQLTKANVKSDPEALRSVLKILETLYDGWAKAVEQLKQAQQTSTSSNNHK
jgi:flagellar protein FliS